MARQHAACYACLCKLTRAQPCMCPDAHALLGSWVESPYQYFDCWVMCSAVKSVHGGAQAAGNRGHPDPARGAAGHPVRARRVHHHGGAPLEGGHLLPGLNSSPRSFAWVAYALPPAMPLTSLGKCQIRLTLLCMSLHAHAPLLLMITAAVLFFTSCGAAVVP